MDDSKLGTWNHDAGDTVFSVELWDTYRTDSHGKSELRYALSIMPRNGATIRFEGEDFHPSPLDAIDSDATVASLLGFFAHYGETIHYSAGRDTDSDLPAFTSEQREALRNHREEIGYWGMTLDPDA